MRIGGFRGVVNASILFTELPLLQRFAAAQAAGFEAVELWWPFAEAVPAANQVTALLDALESAGLSLVSLNLFAGDMASGDRGILSLPDSAADVRGNVEVVVDIARRTGCRHFNALYGQRLENVSPGVQGDTAVANLSYAAKAVGAVGGTLLIESLTDGENGAYPLRTADDAVAVIDRVAQADGGENLRLLLDTYHLINNGDDLSAVIERHGDRIGHVQVADSPGRGQPGTGSIDFERVFAELARHGYSGLVSCEYRPVGPSGSSFGWIREAERE
ncbi:MAG TPA: TIM barrel protein [Mycobacteriales bacterium]|jgi:hydroxypyruvate isomerase|nr:TIM barrel protein [Mycobacteriales bacterium]